MCSKIDLDFITGKIASCAVNEFGNKLHSTTLYGSYARGDFDSESDIDIIILVDLPKEELSMHKKPFIALSSELGLEYDVVVTVNIKDIETFNKYFDVVPYYQNIKKEGISIAV